MKKRCTPTNNAMHVHTPVECSVVTPVTSSCVNPILYIIDEAIIASTENNTPLSEEITLLLEAGVSVTNSNKFCCPTCNDIYYLGYIGPFMASLNKLLPDLKCCYNFTGPATSEGLTTLQLLSCCDNNFIDCVSAINSGGSVITTGLFEYNSMNNESSLCIINDYLIAAGYYDVATTLIEIFKIGVVVKCDGCNLFIGSASAYFNIFID
jgi:hypothetical protein